MTTTAPAVAQTATSGSEPAPDVRRESIALATALPEPSRGAHAADRGPSGDDGPPKAPERIGLQLEVGLSSAYVARGLNVFQASSQMDQHAMVSPSVTYEAGETGLSLGYTSVYQIVGPNRAALVAEGVGDEQDLWVAFERPVWRALSLGVGLNWAFYPFAEPAEAGAVLPSVLEPGVVAKLASVVDLELELLYSAGVQQSLASGRHLYIHPSIGKEVELSSDTELGLAVGAGWKVFADATVTDNRGDVRADLTLDRRIGSRVYAQPGLHWAWTNRDDVPARAEHCVWAGVNGGVDL